MQLLPCKQPLTVCIHASCAVAVSEQQAAQFSVGSHANRRKDPANHSGRIRQGMLVVGIAGMP